METGYRRDYQPVVGVKEGAVQAGGNSSTRLTENQVIFAHPLAQSWGQAPAQILCANVPVRKSGKNPSGPGEAYQKPASSEASGPTDPD